jgi:hypothetical protein
MSPLKWVKNYLNNLSPHASKAKFKKKAKLKKTTSSLFFFNPKL